MKKSILVGLIALAAGAITPARAVDYYDPSDRTVKASPNATTLTTQTLLSGGWYVVPAGTTTINDRIIVSNNVNLVLCDGATLNANSGITVAGGNSLTIWGQDGEHVVSGTSATTRGTGTLFAQTSAQAAAIGGENGVTTGDIVINGGVITARGSWGAGIGRGNIATGAVGSVTINEGHVIASGNSGSAGIGSGAYANSCPVTISGGYVVATGCVYDGTGQATAGIGTGRPRPNGSDPLSNGTITITGGTVIAEAGTGGTISAQAIGVNSVDATHNGTAYLVLGDVRAYASASATTPVAVSARSNTCRGAWVKLETCTSHSDANSDNFCEYCGGYCGPLPPTGPDGALVISTASDWEAFATGVNAGGEPIQGWTVRLAADIGPVSTTVGTADHPFVGTFNGAGHTLTVSINGTSQALAPFASINGATISNLTVAGTVTSSALHAAGLVGSCGSSAPNVIRDCTVAVTVNGSGYAGGIVGHGGEGNLTLDGCVFSGAVNGFGIYAGGLMGWCDALTLRISNCLCTGTFAPSGDGKYHPIACRFNLRTVSATVTGAYYLNTIVPTVPGVNPTAATTHLIPGAFGTPVSTNLVAGEWSQPVTAADGNTYYSWTDGPAGRLLARYSFDDAGNGGLNLLHADVGPDAIVRATTNTVVAGIGAIAAVTDSSILSGLAAGDGAVAIPNGQHLAVPIPAALLSTTGLPYTIVMRIRVPDEVGWRSLVNMPASNDTDAMIYLQRTTRNIYHKQYSKVSGEGVAAANGFVPAEQWATLTFAFGENATDVYLDGTAVLHSTGKLAGSYADCAASGGYILVGADDSYDDDLFYLSEFRIYAGSISPPTLSGNGPDNSLDACVGEQGAVHVAGWAFDPDAPSQSLDIHVSLYTDPDCTNQYGNVCVLKANVPRPDVNNARGISGNHGFDAQIPISDIGTYWVKIVAVDATGDDDQQVGATTRATVTADCTVTVTKFNQSYPYSGKATVEYTIDGILPSNAVAQIVLRTDDATATFVQSNIVAGANTHEIDFASSFGDALWLTNASFTVTIELPGGVQLWENGPYWAECNVGAATPEEYGYYFWWGDTVGYRRENDAWVASDGSTSNFLFNIDNTPTYSKDNATLFARGYIDLTGNLAAAHDAAMAHLGSPWRMPTDAEFSALLDNCTTTWTRQNGVYGRLVTGKGDYADKSIFLPATGYGYGSFIAICGSQGFYWSSTPYSDNSGNAGFLGFASDGIGQLYEGRYRGQPVRPVRRAFASRADGTVTYDPPVYTVEVTKFHQSYPYSGRATIEYTVSWPLPADAVAEIVLRTDDATATFVQSNIIPGANSNVIDFASSFGGALLLTNASFAVTITEVNPGGVQLWENGPYWAECNVGAATPEGYGYYFWWGDTVGYRRKNNAWVASDGSTSSFSFRSSNTPTYGKDNATLLSEGWIDSTGNLVAAHDAATAHLGAPWRIPTDAEFVALTNNCTTEWITTNGVSGQLVMGKGDYANRSIFLPAAGSGALSSLSSSGSYGRCWSSTTYSFGSAITAGCLGIDSLRIFLSSYNRSVGHSVRPVREFALCGADGTVTYERITETTPVPVPYAWLDGYPDLLAGQSGDHEAAARATAANGRKVWTCYVAGLDPSDPLDDFRITRFWMDGNMPMFEFNHTTDGSGRSILPYIQPLGKRSLADRWRHVPDGGKPSFRFFAAEVVPPGCESVVVEFGGVQLWADGPYWAECNVGATSPEESGYYFWWGDTVGYKRENDAWVASDGSTSGFSFDDTTVPTYGKDNAALLSEGWINSTGNLAAAHDAATAHLGAPWRMPTDAEFVALTNNCITTWITTNGVSGRLVTGKGAFADRSIFLPAAGYGYGSGLWDLGYWSHYWSSTPDSDNSGCTWFLDFSADNIERFSDFRDGGWPVRHVRDPDD